MTDWRIEQKESGVFYIYAPNGVMAGCRETRHRAERFMEGWKHETDFAASTIDERKKWQCSKFRGRSVHAKRGFRISKRGRLWSLYAPGKYTEPIRCRRTHHELKQAVDRHLRRRNLVYNR